MKMRIQLIIEDESGRTTTAEIGAIERRSVAHACRVPRDCLPFLRQQTDPPPHLA
jgi:hypothetical protein